MKIARVIGVIRSQSTAAPLSIMLLGIAMFGLASTQPAWFDDRIGPGLFAQWLSASVVALSLIWFVSAWLEGAETSGSDNKTHPSAIPGLGLLAGVALFALSFPILGLVASCALTAMVVSWGAGDRGWIAATFAALSGAGVALALGLTLLPPGTDLWPTGL